MRQPVVIDLETKYTFRQYQDPKKLGISVAGLYDFKSDKLMAFFEKDISSLFSYLESASYIIGFNINDFDLPVLQPYYPGDVSKFATLDILKEVREGLGKSISLNSIVVATLGKKKSGHGLAAIELYNEGKFDELKNYCLDDVKLTKEIFLYGVKNGQILYRGINGPSSIAVKWQDYVADKGNSDISLTLPF